MEVNLSFKALDYFNDIKRFKIHYHFEIGFTAVSNIYVNGERIIIDDSVEECIDKCICEIIIGKNDIFESVNDLCDDLNISLIEESLEVFDEKGGDIYDDVYFRD